MSLQVNESLTMRMNDWLLNARDVHDKIIKIRKGDLYNTKQETVRLLAVVRKAAVVVRTLPELNIDFDLKDKIEAISDDAHAMKYHRDTQEHHFGGPLKLAAFFTHRQKKLNNEFNSLVFRCKDTVEELSKVRRRSEAHAVSYECDELLSALLMEADAHFTEQETNLAAAEFEPELPQLPLSRKSLVGGAPAGDMDADAKTVVEYQQNRVAAMEKQKEQTAMGEELQKRALRSDDTQIRRCAQWHTRVQQRNMIRLSSKKKGDKKQHESETSFADYLPEGLVRFATSLLGTPAEASAREASAR